MTEKTASRRHRAVAAVGAAALGFAGLFGASAAHAAPAFGNIDGDETGSIIVHKHENQVGTPVTGDPEGPGSTLPNPISGATFSAYPITGIDLTTAAGWEKVNAAVVTNVGGVCDVSGTGVAAGIAKGAAVPGGPYTTDANGITVIDGLNDGGLAVGAYLVCETGVPANVQTAAQPFIVTVPFPDNQTNAPSNSNGWLYDVHVYPKNTLKTTVTKSVDQQTSPNLGLGSTVTFPITATVPRIPANEVFTEFAIVDSMDSRLGSVQVVSVTVDNVAVDGSYYTRSTTNPLKVWFNATGLAWLKTQGGKSVVVTVSGVVTSLGDGTIVNTANYFISHAPGENPPPAPPEPQPCDSEDPDCDTTPPVQTNWGNLKLQKVDAAETTATLVGAKFEVYAASDPYATDCSATDPGTAAISVGGETVFTSGTGGIVSIPGLFVSDSVNPTVDAAYRCYWVKEIEAPAGFVVPSDPWTPVQVVKGAMTATYDVQIANHKTVVPGLPLTGAQGQALMIGGGIALLGLGAALYAVRRRQAARR